MPGMMTMTDRAAKTVLCISSYEKGQEFIRECKRQGCHTILLTAPALEHANWPRESIDEIFYMPDLSKVDDVMRGVSFLARSRIIDRIVALDDYDVWTAAALREHLRVPRRRGCSNRVLRPLPLASQRSIRRKSSGRAWIRLATSSHSTCWNATFLVRSITSIRLSWTGRLSLQRPTSTGARRWMYFTRAALPQPVPFPASRRTSGP